MERIKYLLFFWGLTVLVFSVKLQAQGIWIGSYLNSSDNKEITYYQNYWQIKQLGLNTVLQRNIVSVPSINQGSNFDSLMQFSNIIALNDSAFGSAHNENNVDWIYYFTNALYSKWEAEGSPYFTDSEPVGVKHNGVGQLASDGWSSGSNQSDINKFFILGPNYSQYIKYVYTNKFETGNPLVNYKTNFRIKLAQSQTGSFPVAKLIISVKNMADGIETILVDSIIYSNQLATTYRNIICRPYNYSDFQPPNNGESNYSGTPPPGPAWYAPQSTATSKFYDENLKIQFKVQKLAQAEVIVDYIEVYDAGTNSIWENRFIGSINYTQTVNRINIYNQKFTSLGTKLKYYHTIDEPHSIDCFYPIKKVQSILDSLNTGRDLITHFYPGWNNYRDSVNILEKWYKIVQPKKLMFWYFPFTTDATDEFGLRAFRGRLQEASMLQNGFYSTLQTWGYRYNNNPYWYRTPTPNEISAEVMLALSNGAKGIFFEPYYSYISWLPETSNILVEAVVDTMDAHGNFPPRDIYYRIQQLTARLKSKLGATLSKLNHTTYSVNSTYPVPAGDPQITGYDYFQLTNQNNNDNYYYDWYAGFMYDSIFSDRKYFLVTNLRTEVTKTAYFSITNNSGFANLGIFDVEDNSGTINTTINTSGNFSLIIPAGEGYLFQVSPVAKYGGIIAYNDTIKTNTSLIDNMTINNSKTIIINYEKEYTIQDNITLLGTGFITGDGYLTLTSTGEININNWNYSLFKSRTENHPNLVWGKYPGSITVSYYSIFRKIGSGNWQFLANTTNRNYTDSYLTIVPPSGQAGTTVYYKILAVFSNETESQYSNTVEYDCSTKQIEKKAGEEEIIYTYNLAQNYPNPFNPITTINYSLAEDGDVDLEIVDILGRRVAVLLNEFRTRGNHTINFDASHLPSGVYIYKIQSGSFKSSKKMILIK